MFKNCPVTDMKRPNDVQGGPLVLIALNMRSSVIACLIWNGLLMAKCMITFRGKKLFVVI